jgi:hypothetical protein
MLEERSCWLSATWPDHEAPNYKCTDIQDCCKWFPKSDFLFWSDRAPYDTFTDKNITEYIPNRYPQARVKYLSQECVPVHTSNVHLRFLEATYTSNRENVSQIYPCHLACMPAFLLQIGTVFSSRQAQFTLGTEAVIWLCSADMMHRYRFVHRSNGNPSWEDINLSRGPARPGSNPGRAERHLSSFMRATR